MNFFRFEISDWASWGQVYCSWEEFAPLIEEILRREGLPFCPLEGCKPGTNAVFRSGELIVKVFAPKESGLDSIADYQSELFAMERANALGVSVPKLVATGAIADRYLFRYLVMEYIQGETLGDRRASLSCGEKREIGRQLRRIVDRWATPCENFNGIDVIERSLCSPRWRDAPECFRAEWEQFLRGYRGVDSVYVHGDLTADNLLVCPDGKLAVIDFADSVRAPGIYETMPIVCDAFCFDRDFLEGYFGQYDPAELAQRCLEGILIHEYGWQSARVVFGDFDSIRELYEKIYRRLLREVSTQTKNE